MRFSSVGFLMVLVAAVALTLVVPPALMQVIMQPLSGWGPREVLAYKTTLALIFWTPIVALGAVIRIRSQIELAGRSYGTSAVIAEAAALLLLFARILSSGMIGYVHGFPFFPDRESFFSPIVRKFAIDAPSGAAAATVAVWLILALAGTGQRPSGWFDHFCLFFGLFWVLWYLGRDLMFYLPWLW
jgi:hypothetical protein